MEALYGRRETSSSHCKDYRGRLEHFGALCSNLNLVLTGFFVLFCFYQLVVFFLERVHHNCQDTVTPCTTDMSCYGYSMSTTLVVLSYSILRVTMACTHGHVPQFWPSISTLRPSLSKGERCWRYLWCTACLPVNTAV